MLAVLALAVSRSIRVRRDWSVALKVAEYDLLLYRQVKILVEFLGALLLLLWRRFSTRVGWLRMGLRQRAFSLLLRIRNLWSLLFTVATVS